MSPAAIAFSLVLVFVFSSFGLSNADSEAILNDPCPARSDGLQSCPVKCFLPAPVCGENGVTYWCGCRDAACAGARVVKSGYCEVGNSGNSLVSGQAFLLIHIVWLIILGFFVLCGLI